MLNQMFDNLKTNRFEVIAKPARLKLLRTGMIAAFSMLFAVGFSADRSHAEIGGEKSAIQARCAIGPAPKLEITDNREDLNNWHKLGEAEWQIDNYEGAVASFERMRSIGEQTGDMAAVATAMNGIARLQTMRLAMDGITARLDVIADSIKTLTLPTEAELMPESLQKRFDPLHDLLQKAIEIDRGLKRPHRMVKGYTNLARLYWTREGKEGEDPMVETHLKQAIAIGEEAQLEKEMREPYHDLARLYIRSGAFSEAERLYKQSLAISAKINDLDGQLDAIKGLEAVYTANGQSQRAEVMRGQAAELSSRNCSKVDASTSLTLRQWKAVEVLKHERALGHEFGVATSLMAIGKIHQDLKEFDQAEAAYTEALAVNRKLGRMTELAHIYAELARLSMKRVNGKACEYWGLAEQSDHADKSAKEMQKHLGCSA
jgi:tetratricopeptide (TPR) repeat protein